jgi:hypothetical protein
MLVMASGTRVAMEVVVIQSRRPHDIVVIRRFASEEPAEEPEWSSYKCRDEIEIINPICFYGSIESHGVVVVIRVVVVDYTVLFVVIDGQYKIAKLSKLTQVETTNRIRFFPPAGGEKVEPLNT